jgi:hypothetical protein
MLYCQDESARGNTLNSETSDLHARLSMPPKDESARDKPVNSEASRLTYYVDNAIKRCISKGQSIES